MVPQFTRSRIGRAVIVSVLLTCAVVAVAQDDLATRWPTNIRELHWQRQWVAEAVASSSYAETGAWSTEQLLGAPNVVGYYDSPAAWAPAVKDGGVEWIELSYTWPVIPSDIQIIESCGAGAVTRVQLQPLGGGGWVTVLEQAPPGDARVNPEQPMLLVVSARDFGQPTRRVRVEIDTAVPGWNEIDAVGLLGTYVLGARGSGLSTGAYRLWAENALASSTYAGAEGRSRYSPWQATGVPNAAPGDHPEAWATAAEDGGLEWLQVEYPWAVVPTEMNIHENCAPGFVRRIEAVDTRTGQWVTIWEGADPTVEPGGVFNVALSTDVPANQYRIHIDTAVPGWNEIDAVELVGNPVP